MMPWVLVVLLSLPNGTLAPTALAQFRDAQTCEAFRTKLTFQNPDGSPAATFCRRSWRA